METAKGKTKLRICWELFVTFLKASTFTFAGGLAILPALEKDAIDKFKLIDRDAFLGYATLSQSIPGVIVLNCASFVGRHVAGVWGMLAAGFGAILPAFAFMLLATILANLIPKEGAFLGAMRGIRAASAALLLSAAFSLGRHNLKSAFAVVVMVAAFALVIVGKLGAPLVILLAAAAGYLYQRVRRRRKEKNKKNAS
ncbi:MAG TPA: chromate transporter [Clostridia bacterium]|nr:chromate transporter [Clostridia bacterium]